MGNVSVVAIAQKRVVNPMRTPAALGYVVLSGGSKTRNSCFYDWGSPVDPLTTGIVPETRVSRR